MARLLEKYDSEIFGGLKERFRYSNKHAVPKLKKVVVSMGIGRAIENKNCIEHAVRDLSTVTGQRPVIRKARKSVAGFKLRAGMPIGVSVTLRRQRMYEFLDRLISIVVPRIRDFRGLPKKLDGSGNYTFGLAEQTVFPEIDLDKVEFVQGMNITLVTSAETDEEAFALLEGLGVPFRK